MKQHPLLKLSLIAFALFAATAVMRAESAFDEAPTPLRTQAPVYPEALRRDGVSGLVSISVTIDENGNVASTTVTKSSNPAFDQAALDAVARWKFKPAKKAGQPIAANVVLPVRFNAAQ